MCGIAGCFDFEGVTPAAELEAIADVMADALAHRGPDDRGIWTSPADGIALGHRRLSIFDLSPTGHQPMTSHCRRVTIVFNGEIYNHADLREKLAADGTQFRGSSDTEVLVEAIATWGLPATLPQLNGMFAFAVWNKDDRTLTLVRDRIGIKPLFYGRTTDTLLFGSELKALRQHPSFVDEINRDALALFVEHGYIPAPWSIYQYVHKLPAGHTIQFSRDNQNPRPQPYWSLDEIARRGPENIEPESAVEQFDQLLRDSVRLRAQADVPLGAFLSGGIDSSTVVALMQAQQTTPVKAFTIGFDSPAYNEADYARQTADHLRVEWISQQVSPEQAQEVIPKLPTLYDEPFADSSQIPTYLVSRLARQHVTVSLSGDGGDELLGGYNRYTHIQRLWRKVGWLPAPLRKLAASVLQASRPLRGKSFHAPGDLAQSLRVPDRRAFYHFLNRHWRDPSTVALDGTPAPVLSSQTSNWPDRGNFLEEMMYSDTLTYLPECILTKVDRASMGVALEARVPLLDHRIVEFAWSLPVTTKVHAGVPKWPLRHLLGRHVPQSLFERPKVGFGVPIDSWLRGPLRDWAEDLLDPQRLTDHGFFDPAPIREKWVEHQSGTDWHYLLWDILMFQAWHAETHSG